MFREDNRKHKLMGNIFNCSLHSRKNCRQSSDVNLCLCCRSGGEWPDRRRFRHRVRGEPPGPLPVDVPAPGASEGGGRRTRGHCVLHGLPLGMHRLRGELLRHCYNIQIHKSPFYQTLQLLTLLTLQLSVRSFQRLCFNVHLK